MNAPFPIVILALCNVVLFTRVISQRRYLINGFTREAKYEVTLAELRTAHVQYRTASEQLVKSLQELVAAQRAKLEQRFPFG